MNDFTLARSDFIKAIESKTNDGGHANTSLSLVNRDENGKVTGSFGLSRGNTGRVMLSEPGLSDVTVLVDEEGLTVIKPPKPSLVSNITSLALPFALPGDRISDEELNRRKEAAKEAREKLEQSIEEGTKRYSAEDPSTAGFVALLAARISEGTKPTREEISQKFDAYRAVAAAEAAAGLPPVMRS